MIVRKMTVVGIVATSFMTSYSYILSQIKDEHFTEPQILAQLLHRIAPLIKKRYTTVIGWHAHYAVGLVFAAVYLYLWYERRLKPTTKNGLILGGLSGILAVAIWKIVLSLHPNPPNLKLNKYMKQLFIAHLIFGTAATVTYNTCNHNI